MKEQLASVKKEFEAQLKRVSDLSQLEELEQTFFGRKAGAFTNLAKQMKDVAVEQKKAIGEMMNEVRTNITKELEEKRADLQREEMKKIVDIESIDVTQPQLPKEEHGHIHPMAQGLKDMTDAALAMGFLVEDGPELESQYFVFDSLNFPPDHPAREGMDTFYVKDHPELCMRAHVSNMQVRLMRKYSKVVQSQCALHILDVCFEMKISMRHTNIHFINLKRWQ